MPYDPHAPDQASHAYLFRVMTTAALAAPAALALYAWLGADNFMFRILALWAGLPMAYPAIPSRHIDAYARVLMRYGAGWAAAVVGVWIAINGLVGFGDLGYSLGRSLGASDFAQGFSGREPLIPLPTFMGDIVLLSMVACCAFHAGFQWSYRRGET